MKNIKEDKVKNEEQRNNIDSISNNNRTKHLRCGRYELKINIIENIYNLLYNIIT